MFGDYIARGSAGAVFSSPTDRNQVIKIFNLDARDDMVSHMNRLQFQFFEDLEAQQKQDIKTPGLPQINYTFTGKMTPEIMGQIREAVLNHSEDYKDVETDEYLSGLNYAAIKGNFRYGDKYAIILMDRVSQIGPREYQEPLGRRGLTPMLRHAYKMGYYVRDLWPENKGMSSAGDIIWFDPMVAPVNPVTDQDREALKILFEWDEDRQKQYQEAVRDKSYFDYEHKAGLFYADDNTAITNVTYADIDNPEWLAAVPRQMLFPENSELGVLDKNGNIDAQVMLGPDYRDAIKDMVVNNPNGFMMTWAGSQVKRMDLGNTFWVYPYNKITDPEDKDWDAVVMDGDWVMSGGEKGTFDSYPLSDLFDATTGENPVYDLRRFTKTMLGPLPKPSAINYTTILDKPYRSMYAFKSEDDNYWLRGGCGKAAAMISKDLDQKNTPYHYEIGLAYIEGAFIGNHIVVISEAGDQDHYGTQGAKKRWENMLLSELVDQELPPSMVEDIITFQWHKVDPQEDWSVEIAGEYLPVSGPMITKDTLSMSAESGQEIKEYITSIHDGYFLWKDNWDDLEFTLQTLPMEIFEDYKNDEDPEMAWDDSPVSSRRLEDTLNQFRWDGDGYPAVVLELHENGSYEIIDGYHRLNALQILDYDTVDAWVGRPVLSHNAESYPTCYLCPKPAKIEVMTAIGMRSFCGNKCRGDYEGIDYGPDDYFISPKLEHQLEVISYRPGYQERNYSEDATIKIKCKNCDYESKKINSSKPASFYRIHPTNTLKVYPDEEDPEYFELVDCDHDMKIINQLVVGEDAWGNMISGEITVRCSKCRFADILRTDLSDGCDNRGRIEDYLRF